MTAIRNTAIAAIAALTIAASMASPAQALSKKGAWALGIGLVSVGVYLVQSRRRPDPAQTGVEERSGGQGPGAIERA